MSETAGSGIGGNAAPQSELTSFILAIDSALRDKNIASTFPASDERASRYTILHQAGDPLYLFTQLFEDDDAAHNNFELRVEDDEVFLGVKSVLSRNELRKYGPETAAKFMDWQDFSGFSQPDEEGTADFVRMLSDFSEATIGGQLVPLDLSTVEEQP